MQNFIKSQTRLAFIQFIFQSVFLLTYNHTLDNLILVYILGLPFMLYHLISSLVTFTLIGFPFYALFSQGMDNKLNVEDEITSYEQD